LQSLDDSSRGLTIAEATSEDLHLATRTLEAVVE
jgi:hypothetical protein